MAYKRNIEMQIDSPTALNTVLRLALAGHACPQFLDNAQGVREVAKFLGASKGEVLDYIRSLIAPMGGAGKTVEVTALLSDEQLPHHTLERLKLMGQEIGWKSQ